MQDRFSSLHPVVNFLFFAEVLGFSMFLLHPVCLVLSLVCALGYDLQLGGRKALAFALKGVLPMTLLAAVLNPLWEMDLEWVTENSRIIHYCGRNKPWKENYRGELDVFYHQYAAAVGKQ